MGSAWQTQAAARADLRKFLNDGPLDRPVKNKQVIGVVDGSNKEFMTWDDRIAYQWRVTISNMQVRSTYPTGPHPYHKLIWFRGWIGNSPNPNLTGCIDNRSTHTYTSLEVCQTSSC